MSKSFGSLLDDSFDFLDFSDGFSPTFDLATLLPKDVHRAVSVVQGYNRSRSGTATPLLDSGPRAWFSDPPRPELYDIEVMNIFIHLAITHLESTFRMLSGFVITDQTQTELHLAMAAVGGLYCHVPGSYKVAKALYHDARRLFFASTTQTLHSTVSNEQLEVGRCTTVRHTHFVKLKFVMLIGYSSYYSRYTDC